MNDGAIIRFIDTLANITPGSNPPTVINTAGFTRDSPTKAVPGVRTRSLAEQFADYVAANTLHTDEIGTVIAKPLCWSTINEVPKGFEVAQANGLSADEEVVVYIGSSNSYWHSRRIALYAEYCCPDKWTVKVVRSSHPMTRKERWIMEPLKYLRDMWRLSRQKKAA